MQDNPFAHLLPQQQRQPAAQPTFGDPIVAPAPPSERRADAAATISANADARAADAAQRTAAGATFRTVSAQEAQSMGLPEGGVYQVNGLGEIKTVQAAPEPAAGATQKDDQRVTKLRSLLQQIDRTEQLFRDNIKGGWPNPIAGRVPFVPTTEQFESASAGTAEQGLSAFRVPGVGAQSDAELRQFVEANRPLATDTDLRIEEKLRQLRLRAVSELEGLGITLDDQEPQAATAPAFGERDDGAVGGAVGGVAPSGSDPQRPDLRPGGGLDSGDSNEQMGIATGAVRREDNPVLAGVRQEYARRLGEGQSAEQLIRWAQSAGIDPSAYRSIQEQVRFRDENPGVPIEQYDTTQLDDRFVPLGAVDQAFNAAGNSALGAGIIGAADTITAGTLDNMIGAVGGNAERARLAMSAVENANPGSYLAGNIVGGTAAALTGEAALGRLGVQAGLGRALTADVGYGAATGAGMTDDGSSRLAGAARGAVAAGAGSLLGQGAGNALARTARGGSNPQVNALRASGVNDLTIGQAVGGSGRVGAAIKGVEDRMSGVPIIGDMVNARRTEGLRQFNQAAFRKALEPIGGDVGNKVGQEAIEEAQNLVSQAYTKALSGVGVVPDQVFTRDLSSALGGVRSLKRVGPEILDDVVDILRPYDADPMLSGEAIDTISRELRTLKAAYRQDPRFTAVTKQVDRVERAIFDLADRQASGKIPEYMRARQAYRRLSTLEDAVLKAQNQTDGVFTAAQLGRADTANTKKFGGKRAAARGDTPFNELQQAGQEVLPNKVPDSGTAGRVLIPLAALGVGGAADASGQTSGAGLTIGGIVAALYSRTGQRVLTKPVRGMKQGTRRRALMESQRTRRALGVTGAAGGAALASDQ